MSQFQKNDPAPDAIAASNLSSPSSDRGVLLSACELFVSRDRHDPAEKRVFQELALNLLPKASLADRRRVSSILSRHGDAPLALVDALARDEDPLTAYSALRFASNLPMTTLLETIERGPDSLRQAIAERPVLTEQIVEDICRFGGENVVQRLLARPGISRFIKKAKPDLKPGEDVAPYVENITRETKKSPEALMRDFFNLDLKLRNKAVAAAEMTALVGHTNGQLPLGDELVRDDDLVELVVKAARSETPQNAVKLLAQSVRLPDTTADLISSEDNGDTLAVILRATGFSEEEATTVIIRTLGHRRGLLQIRPVFSLFNNISLNAARVLLDQWSEDAPQQAVPAAAAGHQPFHSDAARRHEPASATPAADPAQVQKPFGRRVGFKAS
ncbi:DUF2336 domain-containing protein [Roseibium sediminis]|uniref:DUF2336 domain-containing protein n=1 Tax=Roseibium sediminis TaxID=1775174 RepID=UPI00123DF7D1|nr:DUF2336 domain-containing protein [Roseibium sediminis]